jgi:hypothetical protein
MEFPNGAAPYNFVYSTSDGITFSAMDIYLLIVCYALDDFLVPVDMSFDLQDHIL